MATLRPEDLNLSAVPRNRLGQLKEEGVVELLQRAAWDYREALAEKQRLARTVEELTQRTGELMEQVASLETAASRHREPDELARALLAAAQRTARESREIARQECEMMLKKAARRAETIEEDAAGRAAEVARIEALQEQIVAEATERAATITATAETEAASLLEQASAAVREHELQASSAHEELNRELAAARRTFAEERKSAQAETDAALADARRELARLETETAALRSLRTEAAQEVAEIVQSTLYRLDSLDATSDGAEDDLLGDPSALNKR
jgi:chromosome segregation ATPase